ncbi:MAG: S1 RNA-binding domain-containing protein [Ruminiclostridium sp.]|nr:S1 RNA-binding domain-containing protein [Ruminiclostridium sp.]
MTEYLPEGRRIATKLNKYYLSCLRNVETAKNESIILEAPCIMCDTEHNLIVDLAGMKGIIPRTEGAIGIEDGTTRDIALISRVSKPVCFHVTDIDKSGSQPVAILSRKKAQLAAMDNYISRLGRGDIIPAKVTHMEQFGCFVDIGCGVPSMIPIDSISVSRITHPSDRFYIGQDIFAVVKGREDGRICLTHKELLGTWEENAAAFSVGQTVSGIVRSIEEYGIFVELSPNLAGLAELKDGVQVGDLACVYIKAIIPEKMKVKLIIVNSCADNLTQRCFDYFLSEGRIDSWTYSTKNAPKYIASDFTAE